MAWAVDTQSSRQQHVDVMVALGDAAQGAGSVAIPVGGGGVDVDKS